MTPASAAAAPKFEFSRALFSAGFFAVRWSSSCFSEDIRDAAQAYLDAEEIPAVDEPGSVELINILAQYTEVVDLSGVRPLKVVVVDAANGMSGVTSRATPEGVGKAGGRPVETRVGQSCIKAVMAKEQASFGGEPSAHYYFREFFHADHGMLAAMPVPASLGSQELPLSGSKPHSPTVTPRSPTWTGLAVRATDGTWWFNLRPTCPRSSDRPPLSSRTFRLSPR